MEYITIQRSDGMLQRVPIYGGGGAAPVVNVEQPPLLPPTCNYGGDDELKINDPMMGFNNPEAYQAPAAPQPNYAGAATANTEVLLPPVMTFDEPDDGHRAARGGHRAGGGINNAAAGRPAPWVNSGSEGHNAPPSWD